jgi:indolepyruvate ferredoxin oxidoreductase beta subunit
MKRGNTNVVITGVGGQGNVLMSDLLAAMSAAEGFDAKKSDILGLAVRGGNVFSHVRWGEKISSPVIGRGQADYLVSLEWLETIRQLPYLKKGGKVIINDARIYPMMVSTGQTQYPDQDSIMKAIEDWSSEVTIIPALSLAVELGNAKVANIILIGALARKIDSNPDVWNQVMREHLPPKLLDINLKAFDVGFNF